MGRTPTFHIYVAVTLLSLVALAVGIFMKSPPLISSAAVSVMLGILYLIEASVFGRCLNRILPMMQIIFIVLAMILTCLFNIKCYPGFIVGTIAYPVLGLCAMMSLIAYTNLKFYRELIAVFTVFFALAISNFTGVVIYMIYYSQFDVTLSNALNTQEFAFAFIWSIEFAILFIFQQKVTGAARYFDSERILEVSV